MEYIAFILMVLAIGSIYIFFNIEPPDFRSGSYGLIDILIGGFVLLVAYVVYWIAEKLGLLSGLHKGGSSKSFVPRTIRYQDIVYKDIDPFWTALDALDLNDEYAKLRSNLKNTSYVGIDFGKKCVHIPQCIRVKRKIERWSEFYPIDSMEDAAKKQFQPCDRCLSNK